MAEAGRLERFRAKLAEAEPADDVSEEPFLEACALLIRLVDNIIRSPGEAKFRSIKPQNPKIAGTLLSVRGMRAAVEALGFEEAEGGEALRFPDSALAGLAQARALIAERSEWVREREMRADQAKRKKEWEAKQAELRRLHAQLEEDQAARQGRPKPQASVATERQDGGFKRFEPARGG
eukprot:TRINITY_DN60508_c0_g1_i1.p2 TRINITY_DN60508_c0_g1~~TRINITY_DN60508_c0_g1_i1.p2  ORF type:complete len:179 (+),score=56.70 TRINITY_DN60508_c0_g1_i1:96-632(+)